MVSSQNLLKNIYLKIIQFMVEASQEKDLYITENAA